MKTDDLLILGGAAAAAFFIVRMIGGGRSSGGVVFAPKTIAADAGMGNVVAEYQGWRYYDSGYARGPDGGIYFNGSRLV